MADSGVTNTMAAALGGQRLSYSAHDIPSSLHCCIMSLRSETNGTTTTVVPPCSAYAGNINSMLLPALVGITATIRLSPAIIALIASFCTPLNFAFLPFICWSCAARSIFRNRSSLSILALLALLLNGAFFCFLELATASTAD